MRQEADNRGAIWRRWDPHIHTPGTVLNDQFDSDENWEQFLLKIEKSDPVIEVLGVTDYYSLDNYEKACQFLQDGRMPDVKLIFPNIELRYSVGTNKGAPVNFHLLVSPDDDDHVDQIKRFLQKLTFKGPDDEYRCDHEDIIRLGRTHTENENLDSRSAFAEGANQFKINPDQFLKEWSDSPWVRKNVLIALAVNYQAGTSGLQGDASLASLRRKIESNTHIIFSPNPKDRDFWLGKGATSKEKLSKNYRGCKPCLHGSDAHSIDRVGSPALDRYTWIKGDASFESLRQVCMEPELRVHIGSLPPSGAPTSQTIESVAVANTDWFTNQAVFLNPGLIGVIGGRGSGKTAFVDMIAAGAYAFKPLTNDASFIQRALEPKDLLGDALVSLDWANGEKTNVSFEDLDLSDTSTSPRVQYLSQQFVEQLCSAKGATNALLREIERIIFSAHGKKDRLGAQNFQELLGICTSLGRQKQANYAKEIAEIGSKLRAERDKQEAIPSAEKQLEEYTAQVQRDMEEQANLVSENAKGHAEQLTEVSSAANTVREQVEQEKRRLEALKVLADDVKAFRKWEAESRFTDFKEKHVEAGLDTEEWAAFQVDYVGDVDGIIKMAKIRSEQSIQNLLGQIDAGKNDHNSNQAEDGMDTSVLEESLLPNDVQLTEIPLSILEKEEARLQQLVNFDEEKRTKHKRLSDRIASANRQISRLNETIKKGNAAKNVIRTLQTKRSQCYQGVFEGIEDQEKALSNLYRPLSKRLEEATGTLGKLTFTIRRSVDLEGWATKGESLFDLRKANGFRGHGALAKATEEVLLEAWQTGSAKNAKEAMTTFRDCYKDNLRNAAPMETSDERYADWASQISDWLYSTDHVTISYGIQYEGIDIEALSPGMRGIVLLLLYLLVDAEDDRPLIIDQPEENLDPKSIFQELVGLFRRVKQHRQVIIVTHNANLIVNTDADQVIVAECGQAKGGKLPKIKYMSGSLENPDIRAHVCSILEGGEEAFRQRAKRLRVDMG